MTVVKICGITNLDDAMNCVAAGADILGFNFYRQSPRYIEPLAARRIIQQLPGSILTAGVFVNESSPQTVRRIAVEANVKAVQLHGDEPPEYCRKLNELFVIKALRVNDEFKPEDAARYQTDAILLDGFSEKLFGGSGQTFDWSIAQQTRPLVKRLFLAGGLNETNVAKAIELVRPYGIDACSSLELVPGQKSRARVGSFLRAARMVEQELTADSLTKGITR